MDRKELDVEAILSTLASMRSQIPQLANAPRPVASNDSADREFFTPGDDEAMKTFEMTALADALESFAGELSASIEAANEKVLSNAMEIYYATEELSKDPKHADLIPLVEQMRAAYKRDRGEEIPPKK